MGVIVTLSIQIAVPLPLCFSSKHLESIESSPVLYQLYCKLFAILKALSGNFLPETFFKGKSLRSP